MAIRPSGLVMMAGGSVLLWSGIKGKSVTSVFKDVLTGANPATAPGNEPLEGAATTTATGITGLSLGVPGFGGSEKANQTLGQLMAATYGWTGQNWTALNYGWGTLESSWSATVKNPSSGALGIAQALGHGNSETAGSLGNEYGPIQGMNFPNTVYIAANSGSASAQIAWGLAYIKITYGAPENVPGWLGQGGYGGY